MSEVITDKLTGRATAGDVTITSEGGAATMQLQQGLAKAWVNFDGTGTIATRDSLSVSGLVDNGTGNYTVNITNALSNDDYASVASGNNALSLHYPFQARNSSSSACQVGSYSLSTFADMANVHLILHGDLA